MTTEQASFHPGEQAAQQRWETADLWDSARRERLLWDHIPEAFHSRLEAAPFFFLATSAGLIRILDGRRFAFPDFDGNGAFMSLGNILLNPQVGCLFIDFNDGGRLRVNGRASVHESGPVAALFPAHKRVVLVDIEQVVPNCPQHVPRLQAVA